LGQKLPPRCGAGRKATTQKQRRHANWLHAEPGRQSPAAEVGKLADCRQRTGASHKRAGQTLCYRTGFNLPAQGRLAMTTPASAERPAEQAAELTPERPPISRFPVPAVADLPADLRDRILAVQEKAGFVPNVFLALAHRPEELRAFLAYHDALLLKEGGLSKGEREMIIVATSGVNRCLYCVVAHGAILRVYEKKPLLADQIAVNHRKADISPRQMAMLDFALKVCRQSDEIGEADYAALRACGFSDEDIWDIGAITAFFGLSNRMANLIGMRPNDEFFLMGRTPRNKA
jgi:uncharacterized peroxidase-related enzyme